MLDVLGKRKWCLRIEFIAKGDEEWLRLYLHVEEYEAGDKNKKIGFQLYVITKDREKIFTLDDNSRQDELEDFEAGLGMRLIMWKGIDRYTDKSMDSVEFGATIYSGSCEDDNLRCRIHILSIPHLTHSLKIESITKRNECHARHLQKQNREGRSFRQQNL